MTTIQGHTQRTLNKVPEATLYFWVIKALCSTIGELAGFGTGAVLTALVAALAWQFTLRRYVPGAYWLVVVLLSVTGTRITAMLSRFPPAFTTTILCSALIGIFIIWYGHERTLSLKTITTASREAFYWSAVLLTFALGAALGDWIRELTGWGPGTAALLPAGLILGLAVVRRSGAAPVLTFWLIFTLTRPLGTGLGDYLALPAEQGGLGLGRAMAGIIFLPFLLGAIGYLIITGADRFEGEPRAGHPDCEPGAGLH